MIVNEDVDDLKAKQICYKCTEDEYLSREIKRLGKKAQCDYCLETRRCYTLDQLSEGIEIAFDAHYQRTASEPDGFQSMMQRDPESEYEWEREGEKTIYAIMNAARISEEAAGDLQTILDDRHFDFDSAAMGDETEFSDEAYYEEKGDYHSGWANEWAEFERSLQTEARFFNQLAISHLASLFEGIEGLTTRNKRPVIVDGGPGTQWAALFRARVFQSDEELETALARPDRHLGPPPPRLAVAGRMNARGISVFYGANSQPVALAEVRPPVGSKVAIARFDIISPLRLLDLTAFDGLVTRGSAFDPAYLHALEKAAFLRTFGTRLSRPVMPNDEAFAYLATQAVADFLATERRMKLDGLIFPSAQAGASGRNVVLFHKAARIKPLEYPPGTNIEVRLGSFTEDGWEDDYSVIEETPPPAPAATTDRTAVPSFKELLRAPEDSEEPEWNGLLDPTLQIAAGEIEVHIIQAVSVKSEKHPVSRHQWERTDSPDF
jgi:hypothetical protein